MYVIRVDILITQHNCLVPDFHLTIFPATT